MNDKPAEQQQIQLPPMVVNLDEQVLQLILAGLLKLPGEVAERPIAMLRAGWDAHVKRSVDAALQKAKDDAAAATAAAAVKPSREQRRAAARTAKKRK